MSRVRGVVLGLLVGVVVARPGLAAEGGVTQVYLLEQLADRPGHVIVAPDYLTVLEFDEEVSRIASARGDLINVEVAGNLVLLRAAQRSGATDLITTVGGRIGLFTVEIDARSRSPRRYVIRSLTPQPMTAQLETGVSSPVERQAAEPTSRVSKEASTSVVVAQRSEAKTEAVETAGPVMRIIPEVGPRGLVLFYVLENPGGAPISGDLGALRVRANGAEARLSFTRLRPDSWAHVAPGGAEYGVVLVWTAAPAELDLEWPVVEVGTNRTYVLRWQGEVAKP